jgi:hydrogenase-4 component F
MHAWLPDAHSEAPSPVSSMLSGALLNCALLAILRVYKIVLLAGLEATIKPLMLFMGLFSVFVCAVFILRVKNYKRMLAYSSVENMGIILIGAATGGAGLFGAMLHTFSHSLSKAMLFLTSGNILKIFGKKEIENVTGVLKADKFTGWLWIAGFVFISGIPPAPSFLSEFIIIKELLSDAKYLQAIILLVLLTVIIFGMGSAVFKMSFGESNAPAGRTKHGFFAYLPQFVMLLALLLTGLFMPEFISAIVGRAAMYLG